MRTMRTFLHPFFSCILLFVLFLAPAALAYTPAKPAGLKVEYLVNPLGIDATQPRFSWRLVDERTGARQRAYQLFLSTDSQNLKKGLVWQSAKINGAASLAEAAGLQISHRSD